MTRSNQAQLSSSLLSSAQYLSDERALLLTFAGGEVYRYESVDRSVFNALRRAPSPGRYFNRNVRGRFPCSRL